MPKIYADNKQIPADIGENPPIIRDNQNLIYANLTYKIRGCIFTVYNHLGCGHKEQVLNVKYRDVKVGKYIPDFVIDNKIILEIKANQ